MPAPVPAEALAAARLGAGWAFEGIYAALAGHVRRFLGAQGAPDPEATTQEVFLRVFRSLGRFEGDVEHLRSWVFAVARNLLIDERRAASRQPVLVAEAAPDHPSCAGQEDIAAGLDAFVVRDILGALSEEQREVLVLRFLLDMPLCEVATIVGRSLPAVKALQHRGLASLRRRLADPIQETASSAVPRTFIPV